MDWWERALGVSVFGMPLKELEAFSDGSSGGNDFLHGLAFQAYGLVGTRAWRVCFWHATQGAGSLQRRFFRGQRLLARISVSSVWTGGNARLACLFLACHSRSWKPSATVLQGATTSCTD